MNIKFLFLLICVISNCLADQTASSYCYKNDHLYNVLNMKCPFVKEITDEKIYINEKFLSISSEGIFLDLSGHGGFIQIPELEKMS